MTIEFDEYDRAPFTVNAKQVTLDNIEELAQICGGVIEKRDAKMLGAIVQLPIIRLKGTGDNRGKTFEATLGCWIVELKGSYRVYKEAQFQASFVKRSAPTDDELLALAEDTVASTTGMPIGEAYERAEAARELENTSHDCVA